MIGTATRLAGRAAPRRRIGAVSAAALMTAPLVAPLLAPRAARLEAQASPAPATAPAAPAMSPDASRRDPTAQRAGGLSLADAVRIAVGKSEAVRIAQAGITRARGQVAEARAAWFPQLSASAGYTRTLQTQYSALAQAGTRSDSATRPAQVALCSPRIDSLATPAQRQAALNAALSCPSNVGGLAFSSVGFGALNQFTFGLSFSQTLFSGQVLAQNQAVSSPRRSAEIDVRAQKAQVTYDVTQAYYGAALADRLVTIAESTLVESDRTLHQAQLARRVGTQSDFDLLQAQVTRNNQVPVVIQRRSDRDISYYQLKQLLKLPLDAPLTLTTDVEDSTAAPDGVRLASLTTTTGSDGVTEAFDSTSVPLDTAVDRRSTVREQVETVKEEQALRRLAAAEHLPSLNLVSQYQRVAYPIGVPAWSDFLTNWNVGVALSVPLFTGGRIHGDELVAEANLVEARARLQQTRELAALDARTALATLRQAQAAWVASVGTVGQATRAYQIAELRYREGISTQTELTDQRIAEQQALANRALAARSLQVARVRLALLADLPLAAGGAVGASAAQSAAQSTAPGATSPQGASPQGAAAAAVPTGPPVPGTSSATGATATPYTTSGQMGSTTP
jgi:outer membrane protein